MKRNFADEIRPWLEQLREDPEQPLPEVPVTSFPSEFPDDWLPIDADEFDAGPVGRSFGESVEEDQESARKAYGYAGIDVLAFYKSFRFSDRPPFKGKWGIFVLDAGVNGLTAEFRSLAPAAPYVDCESLAVELLLAHEQYHFWIDAWTLCQELMPLGAQIKRYEYYIAAKHSLGLDRTDLEEGLANHYARERVRKLRRWAGLDVQSIVTAVLRNGPGPYSDFEFNREEKAAREALLARAAATGKSCGFLGNLYAAQRAVVGTVGPTSEPAFLGASLRPARRDHPFVGVEVCPQYFVRTTQYSSIVASFQGPNRREFFEFLKNFLDGKPESVTDHTYYKIDNGEKIKIPNPHDKHIRGHEWRNTRNKAGMTEQDYRDARIQTKCWTEGCPRDEAKPSRAG